MYPILSKAGWGVRVEVEGLQALHQVHQNPPDLILLDIMLPGLDGFNVCQQLKADAKTADIPVIFMTALTDTADKLKGFSLGAVDYITKPFQQEEVLARVKLHLESQHMAKLLHSQNTQLQRLMLELETRVEERTRALK
ncbi:MAG: response regulator, partial [Prochlorotrichaceae cyanobacterium]